MTDIAKSLPRAYVRIAEQRCEGAIETCDYLLTSGKQGFAREYRRNLDGLERLLIDITLQSDHAPAEAARNECDFQRHVGGLRMQDELRAMSLRGDAQSPRAIARTRESLQSARDCLRTDPTMDDVQRFFRPGTDEPTPLYLGLATIARHVAAREAQRRTISSRAKILSFGAAASLIATGFRLADVAQRNRQMWAHNQKRAFVEHYLGQRFDYLMPLSSNPRSANRSIDEFGAIVSQRAQYRYVPLPQDVMQRIFVDAERAMQSAPVFSRARGLELPTLSALAMLPRPERADVQTRLNSIQAGYALPADGSTLMLMAISVYLVCIRIRNALNAMRD